MGTKDTIDETAGTGTENEKNSSTEPATEESKQPKPDGNNQPSGKTYTEAEYKGLQAVIAKRDQTIADLTNKNQELENEIADLRSKHGTVVSEKTDLSEKITSVTEEKSNLENQIAVLEKKLANREIIMKDFPELAPFMSLFPEVVEDEEELRSKAKEIKSALGKYVGDGVKNALSGASPVVSGNEEDSTLSVDEAEKWYQRSVQLAGIRGKEQEYEEAYQKYLELSKQ